MKKSRVQTKPVARLPKSPAATKPPARRPALSQAAAPSSPTSQPSTILLAVTGMSPAVLTETVWALAQEKPTVIPDRVVVLTTVAGSGAIERELLAPGTAGGDSNWQRLRLALLGDMAGEDHRLILDPPRMIATIDSRTGRGVPVEDIRHPADNTAAANFILEEVRRIVENRDTRLVASLAGGRKTMGALLYAAMTLLGRETDRLTHVLVNEPFDDPRLQPRFYFPPDPPRVHWLSGAPGAAPREFSSADARIELADVPFVPLRNRFLDLAELPGSFHALIARYSRQFHADATRKVRIEIRLAEKALIIEGQRLRIRPKALAILHALLVLQDDPAVQRGQMEAQDKLTEWLAQHPLGGWQGQVTSDDIKHELSFIRSELKRQRVAWMPPLRSLRFPPFQLVAPSNQRR